LGVGLTTLPCKKENCWEASKKFSRILRRRPRPKLGCGAKERRRMHYETRNFVSSQNYSDATPVDIMIINCRFLSTPLLTFLPLLISEPLFSASPNLAFSRVRHK
jgi:hypothetical protein